MGDGGRALIKQRGRWQSDVASVYQRAIVDAQLEASAGIGDAAGVELEANPGARQHAQRAAARTQERASARLRPRPRGTVESARERARTNDAHVSVCHGTRTTTRARREHSRARQRPTEDACTRAMHDARTRRQRACTDTTAHVHDSACTARDGRT
eukprot:3461987-Pleurochrysis_carterae.AAC.1